MTPPANLGPATGAQPASNPSPHWDLPASYAAMHQGFHWQVPSHYNMAQQCCGRWAANPATAQRVAVWHYTESGAGQAYTYAELQLQANRLSNVLAQAGVQAGDRVAIVLAQGVHTAVAYMAVLQMGAVAMPLSQLFGPEALAFRLQDSDAGVALCDAQTAPKVQQTRAECPQLRQVIGLQCAGQVGVDQDFEHAMAQASYQFSPVVTLADEPAILIYTSGTTGNPKGASIPHRALIGNLTGFVCSQNGFGFASYGQQVIPDPQRESSQAVFWSPADWAWTGGLMDALLPTLYFGCTIVAYPGRFAPQLAFELMRDCAVTHTFLFPTALKAMMKAYAPTPGQTVQQRFGLRLQAIMSAGEAVGDAVFAYCQNELGVTVNEMFGQTEINYIVGNSAVIWPPRPGSMGMGYPGHRVAVIDDAGRECGPDEIGDVAVHRLDVHGQPDPIFFLGYWRNDAATEAKYTGDWCRTGDLARRDAQGYLWYQGRSDDVFKAAGYRIGPGEIENCLVKHPAVANAAVVPKPDAERGAVVKAFVVLAPDWLARRAAGDVAAQDQALMADLQAHVRGKLAPYEYPKDIEFVDALPMTTTGKVQRRVLRLLEVERAGTQA
jgi:acetyl-CoA synthetase